MANLAQNGVPTDNQSAWGLLQSSPLEGTSKIYLVKDILNNYDNILRYVINNKVSNSDFDSKINNITSNGGGTNLLTGTAKCEFPLNGYGGTQTVQKYDDETDYIQYTSNTPMDIMGSWWTFTPEAGQVYTLSADVTGNGYITGAYFRYEDSDSSTLSRVDLTDNWQRISNTFRVNSLKGNWVIYADNSTLLKVKHIKIEKGIIAHDWSPAPSDMATVTSVTNLSATVDGIKSTVANKADQSTVTQLSYDIQSKVSSSDFDNLSKAVELQTLDSADINNMRTNGHYFVHNLANNPIGGWVYVDVTGNGTDRIRQDVYKDTDNQHFYRRWNYSWWTDWSKGATESEINNLQNQINGTGIGRTPIQWSNGAVTGGNGVYKLIKNNILYINGYGQFNVDSINNFIVANIPEAKGRVINTALWIDSISVDTIALKENGDIEFWGGDLKGKWFYINAAIPLI